MTAKIIGRLHYSVRCMLANHAALWSSEYINTLIHLYFLSVHYIIFFREYLLPNMLIL